MTQYISRDLEPLLQEALRAMPVVVITGMRQVGKSTLLQNAPFLKERVYHTLDDYAILNLAKNNPEMLFQDTAPITIDEVQRCPELLMWIKKSVDQNRIAGRFLLSGSANLLLLKNITESLAGRAIYFNLNPFSYREISQYKSTPLLVTLLNEVMPKISFTKQFSTISLENVLVGGMPSVCLNAEYQKLWFKGFEQTYIERDIRDLSQVADLSAFRNLIHLTALRTGQIVNISELGRDAKLNATTTSRYVSLAEASFLLYKLSPFLANKTSRLIKSPKFYFTDSGIATHLCGLHEKSENNKLLGSLLETYVAQNITSIIQNHLINCSLHYWNIQGRYEVDFIIESANKSVAIEVKSSSVWNIKDFSSLQVFIKQQPNCIAGILAYNGTTFSQVDEKLYAIPISLLIS